MLALAVLALPVLAIFAVRVVSDFLVPPRAAEMQDGRHDLLNEPGSPSRRTSDHRLAAELRAEVESDSEQKRRDPLALSVPARDECAREWAAFRTLVHDGPHPSFAEDEAKTLGQMADLVLAPSERARLRTLMGRAESVASAEFLEEARAISDAGRARVAVNVAAVLDHFAFSAPILDSIGSVFASTVNQTPAVLRYTALSQETNAAFGAIRQAFVAWANCAQPERVAAWRLATTRPLSGATTPTDRGTADRRSPPTYDTPPELLNAAAVQQALESQYPPSLKDAGIGGRVELWLYVSEEGQVANFEVKTSSGDTLLDEAAARIVQVMRFTPARDQGGEVTAVWISQWITFRVT